jgi:hypothetical protein
VWLHHQVWDQQFFKSGFGPELGAKIMEDIVDGLKLQDHRFGVYAGEGDLKAVTNR